MLTLIGAAAGIGLAKVATKTLMAASPLTFPTFVRPSLDASVLAFTIGVALLCGVMLGLAPAMHARMSRLTDALKESARGTGGARSQRLRASLMVGEVALAIVLLVGAGLMIRTVQKLTAIDPGFDPSGVLSFSVSTPRQPGPSTPPPPGTPPPFMLTGQELLERAQSVPGVQLAALASDVPLDGNSSAVFYAAEGDTTTDAQTVPRAYFHRVSPAFFDTLRLPLELGRTFTDDELRPENTSVIVSDNVARRFWPNQNPLGKRIKVGAANSPSPWLNIIGVVGEVKYRGLPNNPTADPDLYLPALPRSPQTMLVRTSGDPAPLIGSLRAAIREGRPSVVVFGDATLQSNIDAQTSASRFTTWILGLFATTALLLSVIGIYGVMSYLVTLRRREFGIRLALGARRSSIVQVVLRHGARLIAIGAVIGIAGTAALSQLLTGLLYGVTTVDVSSAVAVAGLIVVALMACVVPALRATRVDPITALRAE